MNNEKIINSTQLFGLLFVYKLFTVILYPSVIDSQTSIREIIISLLIFSVLSFFLLYPIIIYKKSNYSINSDLLNTGYIIYFSFILLFHIYDLYRFISDVTGNDFNTLMCIIFLILFAIYASSRGLEAIARFSVVIMIFAVLLSFFVIICLLPSFSAKNLMTDIKHGDSIITIFSEIQEIAVLFILCKKSKGSFFRECMLWNIFQYLLILVLYILIFGSLGYYLKGLQYPLFHSIEGSGILQRMNAIFLSAITALGFTAVTVDFYIVSELSQKLSFKKIKNLNIPLIIIVSVISVWCCFNTDLSDLLFQQPVIFYSTLVFAVAIPISITIYIKFKSKFRKTAVSFLLAAGILVSSLSVSGCSATQLNQRIIIQGIGIDNQNNEYSLTMLILDTESDSKRDSEKIVKTKGKTVENAVSSLEKNSGKNIMLSQCLFIIMDKNAADRYNDSLGYFCGQKDIMKTVNLIVTENSSRLLESAVNDMDYNSERINLVTDSKTIKSDTVSMTLFDYISYINKPYYDLTFPYIKISDETKSIITDGSYTIKND